MTRAADIIRKGKEVVRIEAEAVAALEARIDQNFAQAVEVLFACRGRVVVTGMGKSGNVARKIVATFNSTGTPALFLHPSDALHGDLGMVRKEDVVICISKSGDTAELHNLLPMFKRIGVPIIAMVGNPNSKLALISDMILDAGVKEEACPYDLAPTSSSTAALVFGDALAMALLQLRNFTVEDFALYHPGGSVGRRLLLKIEELMVKDDAVPRVKRDIPIRDAIIEMTSKRLGATCVVDGGGKLIGIITDGDLRRFLQKTTDVTHITADMVMTKHPKTISENVLAALALQEMEAHNISQLVVVDGAHRPVGMVHLHELVKAGLGGDTP
ncbi:MAG: KpsF/GutQ family sugar-phosphate isomerase [Ignavibacteria bacterium]|nr:MAG: KpsF/GutQ family sugar-phosphate isomerase [Ignavibacteria bacterium]